MKQPFEINLAKAFLSFILILCISSCSSISPYKVPILQGNIFEEEDLEKLSEGLTKEQVQFIFGTALIKDPFHSSRWDYYYSIRVGSDLLSESKLSVFFNGDGLVESWVIEDMKESNYPFLFTLSRKDLRTASQNFSITLSGTRLSNKNGSLNFALNTTSHNWSPFV